MTSTALKFPIGEFVFIQNWTMDDVEEWIQQIEDFPMALEHLTHHNTQEELDWKYRPDGWTSRQVIHHCADSHMNSFIRFKLALTEETPEIRPYFENRWAELPDGKAQPTQASIDLLKGLHQRWTYLLEHLTEADLHNTFTHPEHGTVVSLAENAAFYAWHCAHHLAHVKQGLSSEGKYN